MEVVMLNERLRRHFSTLLKQLPPRHDVSAAYSQKISIHACSSPSFAVSGDLYTKHCRFMLWRLNSYQYGSASAFLLDLEQLERVATSPEAKKQVHSLLNHLAASEGEKQGEPSAIKVSNKCGTTVLLGSSSGVPGLQKVASNKSDQDLDSTWLCNVTLGHQFVTIGTFSTKEEALQEYQKQRKRMAENAAGFNKLRLLASKLEQEQHEQDERVLKDAMAQCHPRLTTMKVAPTTTTAVTPAPSVTSSTRGIARVVAKNIASATISSPGASPAPSETGASPLKVSRASTKHKAVENLGNACVSPKKQKTESANNSTASSLSVSERSYLKLRRLIQKRLCRHLKGKEVCVVSDVENRDDTMWSASGRLEAGKVFSFSRKKQMPFADYVRDELGRAESACAHMFLVHSKESIDDHLKVCDAFSDKDRQLGPATDSTSKRRKGSRRTS
ncbi:hypothetical protein PsorP6_013842 [Peronosclerospora sorghi]|uniref:Uncharacterized protein n=1 Tax=Peronosclerospora sorghi TaxID=230839 RepID=A0ACC0VGK1_9STRA|nr:hypothetical protein PsorP6_013842 [Peronosclerospora sorghi]